MRVDLSSAGRRMMVLVAGVALLAATVSSTANAQDVVDPPAEPEVVYRYDHVPDKDIELNDEDPIHSRRLSLPYGLWGDSDTIYVAAYREDKAFAFNLGDTSFGTYDASSSIDLQTAQWTVSTPSHWSDRTVTASLDGPRGIWMNSDYSHMYVAASSNTSKFQDLLEGIWKVNIETGEADDFWNLHSDNSIPGGIWSNGRVLWVLDRNDNKVYAYNLDNGTRDRSREFRLIRSNRDAVTIYSDETTMWVTDYQDDKVYAYTLSDGRYDSSKSFSLAEDNDEPTGLWSDDTTMWVADQDDEKLYAYSMTGDIRVGGF